MQQKPSAIYLDPGFEVRKFGSADTQGNASSGGFLSVAIKQPAADCKIEIIRLDGTRIQFHGAVDAGFIKSLLD